MILLVAVATVISLLLPSGAIVSLFGVHLPMLSVAAEEFSTPVTSVGIVVGFRKSRRMFPWLLSSKAIAIFLT